MIHGQAYNNVYKEAKDASEHTGVSRRKLKMKHRVVVGRI